MEALVQKAKEANAKIKASIMAVKALIPFILANEVKANLGDSDRNRALATKIAPLTAVADVRDWHVGMITDPGDLVYDPEHANVYIYTGTSRMTHTDADAHPGALHFGSSFSPDWFIIPKLQDGVKIYPDASDIAVSVRHGEHWWDIDKTAIYSWNGEDTDNCVWPPAEGSEWTRVDH